MGRVVIPGFRKIEISGGGGEGGTGNYNDLTNKPSINNVPLVGNLSTVDLKLTDKTLTEEGVPAEAKTVGDKLEEQATSLIQLKKETTVNLLKPTFETTTFNGVTFINNGDGSISISGAVESGASAYTPSVLVPVNIGQTYRVIGKFIGVYKKDNATKILQSGAAGDTTPSTFTATEDFVNVCMYVSNTDTIPQTGVISYPMLTTNLNATNDDFVPYTGDSGSINWDVADLRGDMNYVSPIKFTNIAWIDSTASMFDSETNGITYEYMGDGAIKISGTVGSNSIEQEIARFIGEIPDSVGRGKVKLLGLPFDTSNESFNIGLKIGGHGGVGTVARTSSKDGVIIDLSKIPSSKRIYGIYLSIPNGTVIPNNFIIRPFLTTNLDATLNDFVPYTGSKGQLNEDLSQVAYSIGNPSNLLTNQKILVNAINELNNRLTALENK